MRYITNQAIIDGLLGDNESEMLNYLYKRHFQEVKHYIVSNSGTEAEALDIFQDSLLLLYNKLHIQRIQLNCSPGTYLYSVAKNMWLRELRRRRVRNEIGEIPLNLADTSTEYHTLAEEAERLHIFKIHYEQLGDECKQLMQLIMDGNSLEMITHIMNYSSVQYTKNRRSKCKERLWKSIRNDPHYKELNLSPDDDSTNEVPRW
jgi:RNA polymerase sigma factor (sigma-70 family)